MSEQNLNPKVDVVFRKLFGGEESKEILISLINSVVEPDFRLTEITIKNPFNLAAYRKDKESVLDIKAVDQNGAWYDIEMQVTANLLYGKRAVYYLSKIYTEQLGKGRQYSKLNTAIGIHFLNFAYFEEDDEVVRQFVFKNAKTNRVSEEVNHLRLYFVEMGKFRKDWPEVSTALDRWIAFLKKAVDLELGNLPAPLREDPAIVRAAAELERMGMSPEERDIYEREAERLMLDEIELKAFEDKMLQRGMQQGMQQGMRQGAQQALQRLLLNQMSHRIGEVPGNISSEINRLTQQELDDLGIALFDLKSYAEIERWLTRH
jgi:predicted transposase/invertase (TIGR01784 family)